MTLTVLCVRILKPLGTTHQNQEAYLSASRSTADEFKQGSLGLGKEGVDRFASCVCKLRVLLQHRPGMPHCLEQGLSLAFSPRDLEISRKAVVLEEKAPVWKESWPLILHIHLHSSKGGTLDTSPTL